MFLVFRVIIIGRIITISISKIRNNTAIKKNFEEKGIREDLLGSNPHSNGDIFSRSRIVFLLTNAHIVINKIDNEIVNKNDIIILNNTFS